MRREPKSILAASRADGRPNPTAKRDVGSDLQTQNSGYVCRPWAVLPCPKRERHKQVQYVEVAFPPRSEDLNESVVEMKPAIDFEPRPRQLGLQE